MPQPKVAEIRWLVLATIESHRPLPTFVDFLYKSKAENISNEKYFMSKQMEPKPFTTLM